MIRVDVQPYCSECCDFDPDITKPVKLYCDGTFIMGGSAIARTDTIIRCSHAKRCEAIKRYLEHQEDNKNE